jgi:hypothetical protein
VHDERVAHLRFDRFLAHLRRQQSDVALRLLANSFADAIAHSDAIAHPQPDTIAESQPYPKSHPDSHAHTNPDAKSIAVPDSFGIPNRQRDGISDGIAGGKRSRERLGQCIGVGFAQRARGVQPPADAELQA